MSSVKITEEVLERAALAMVRATAEHYGDPMPTNPDLRLTKILARAALEAAQSAATQ